MEELTHRQRALMSLSHQEADRIPIDLGGRVSSMMQGIYTQLKKRLNVITKNETVSSFQTINDFDEEVLKRFDIDFRRIYFERGPESIRLKENFDGTYVNEWRITIKRVGPYIQRISHPLAEATIEDLKNYPWPDAYKGDRASGLKEKARSLYETTDYAIFADAVNGGIFEYAQHLRGMDRFFMDMVSNKDFAEALLDRVLEVLMGLFDVYLNAVGEYIQIILYPDDYGMQTGLLISPQLFREMIKPRLKKLIDFIKGKTKAKIMLHSDGSIYKIINDLIEIGIDILNPCQPYAKDMEPEKLKEEFGDKVVFHGAIDQHKILQEGTVEEVKKEVHRKIKGLASGGGYILAPAHNIEEDTPVENLIAMYDSAKGYGWYPIRC